MTANQLTAAMSALMRACPEKSNAERAALAVDLVTRGTVKFDAFGVVYFTDEARAIESRLPGMSAETMQASAREADRRVRLSAASGNDDRAKIARAAVYEERLRENSARAPRTAAELRAELATISGNDDRAKIARAKIHEQLIALKD